jgi:hypothetical protein
MLVLGMAGVASCLFWLDWGAKLLSAFSAFDDDWDLLVDGDGDLDTVLDIFTPNLFLCLFQD